MATLSKEEIYRKKIRFAVANQELEGYVVPDELKKIVYDLADDKISKDEAFKLLKETGKRLTEAQKK